MPFLKLPYPGGDRCSVIGRRVTPLVRSAGHAVTLTRDRARPGSSPAVLAAADRPVGGAAGGAVPLAHWHWPRVPGLTVTVSVQRIASDYGNHDPSPAFQVY